MMKYAVLASGSKGNSTIVSSGKTNILIDCGISKKRLNERLAICGLGITDINIVLVTHSHSDHTAGLKNFDESMQFSQLFVLGKNIPESQILCPFTKYKFGDFFVTPIPLSHDAINTTGYIIEDKNEKLVYITDTGYVSEKALDLSKNADYYIFESNHDPKMLCESGRPQELIKRILSDHGHLSNLEASYYLSGLVGDKTKEIVLAHLSEECNTPQIALETYNKVMMTQLCEIPNILVRCADETNVYKGGNWNKELV